jgi:hypothetical protein
MYIKVEKWSDSEEPDELADKYPHRFCIEVFASDEIRKQLELEGQLEALIDGLLDWRESLMEPDLTDWRLDVQ